MRLAAATFALCFLVAAAAPCRAEEAPEVQAKRLFERGMAHFHLEEYDEAIRNWTDGFRTKPAPEFLFNLAQAYRLSHRPEQALKFYGKYLSMNPQAANRADVERVMADLKKDIEVHKPAGEDTPPSPPPATPQTAAPTHPAERGAPPPATTTAPPDAAAPPPSPDSNPTRTSPITFSPKDTEAKYVIDIQGKSCVTPCTLQLSPAASPFKVRGNGSFAGSLAVPDAPAQALIQHRSLGSLIAGLAMLGVGAAGVVTGGVYIGYDENLGGGLLVAIAAPILLTGFILAVTSGRNRIQLFPLDGKVRF